MSDRGGLVHIGCYTPATGGRGEGIVLARRDPASGALTVLGTAAVTDSPSFLVRHPTLDVLYAVNELPEGTVSAFQVATDGGLTPLGVRSTGGDSPCHLAVAPDGRHLYVANYGSGSVSVHPLDAAGVPGDRSDLLAHSGHGADPERQDRAHAHMVSPHPADGSVLAVDLGTDSVYRYELEPASGRLVPRAPRLRTPAGTGPRHLARHPDGRRGYLVGELDATLTEYELHPGGVLHERHRVPASDRTGHVQPSEVSVAPDGRFGYVANRGVGTLAVFALADGQPPRLVTEVATGGGWPRHFARVGEHLYVADERAHLIRIFQVDPGTGIPTPVGEPVEVPSPVCVLP
ncbi:lactonase family protein [Micromonospora sp. CPCC 206060]|uniref:lactonase family protein n=1 Tax=Micromonospora sp. CPCC 206060 TaxID=3122406 RepID=UPI002FF383F2